MDVERLGPVSEEDALIVAGATATRHDVGDVIVALGPTDCVIIAPARDELGRSGVWSAGLFRLHGPVPAPVSTWFYAGPPAGITHLFIRVDDGCLDLGRVFSQWAEFKHHQLVLADLVIDPPLSDDLLDLVRPPVPPSALAPLDWTDVEPVEALRRFLHGWYPDVPLDSTTVTGSLAPLTALHRLAEQRPDLLGVQNEILREPRPDETSGRLLFAAENQNVHRWLLDPSEDDPTVWKVDGTGSVAERERLGGFLLQFVLFEAVMGAPYGGIALEVPAAMVPEIVNGLVEVPRQPWRWPSDPTRFYVAPGVIVVVSETDDHAEVLVGARHRSLLRRLAQVDHPWERLDA